MQVDSYVKSAACSKIIISWLAVYGFIGAYLGFAGFGITDVLLFLAAYMAICFSYLFFTKKNLERKRMSYVMHPLFFAAPVAGFVITVFENDGRNLTYQCIYLIFVIAGYMVNCYLSAFAVNLAGESRNRASVLMKYSRYRNLIFAIWLTGFVLAALLAMLIPVSGIRIFRMLSFGTSRGGGEEAVYENIEEELPDETMTAQGGEADSFLLIVLGVLVAVFVITVIVLGRKLLARGDRAVRHTPELPEGMEEEVTIIRRSGTAGKGEEEITGNSTARVRKYFAKTVKRFYPDKVDKAKTPSQLLLCEGENRDEKQEDGEHAERSGELRDIYEKARYSDKPATKEEAKKAKELSAELIKKKF